MNRTQLLPAREQVRAAFDFANAEKERLRGRMQIFYVLPDYFENRPKPCMNGWGRRYVTVNRRRPRAAVSDRVEHSEFAF